MGGAAPNGTKGINETEPRIHGALPPSSWTSRAEVGVISEEQWAVRKQTFLLCRLGPCQALLVAADCRAEGGEGNLSLCLLSGHAGCFLLLWGSAQRCLFIFIHSSCSDNWLRFADSTPPPASQDHFTTPFQNYPTSQSVPPPQRTASTGQGPSSKLLSSDNSNSHLCSYGCHLQLPLASFPFAFSVLQYPSGQFLHENAWCGFWFPSWTLVEQYPRPSVSLIRTLLTPHLSLGIRRFALLLRASLFLFLLMYVLWLITSIKNCWKHRKHLQGLDSEGCRFKIWFFHLTK